MKKHFLQLISLLCAAALFCGAAPAFAASAPPTIQAEWWGHDIWFEGERAQCLNAQGERIWLFSCNGTVYLSVRTAGEWMGKAVTWDQDTQTVTLSGGGAPVVHPVVVGPTPQSEVDAWNQFAQDDNRLEIQLRPDISVVLDGQCQAFFNVKGESVYPAVCNGVTYLPVRNIGQLCGKDVTWANNAQSGGEAIFIRAPLTQAEKAEVAAFIAAGEELWYQANQLENGTLLRLDYRDDSAALSTINLYLEKLKELRRLPRPTMSFAQSRCDRIDRKLDDIISHVGQYAGQLQNGTPFVTMRGTMRDDVDDIDMDFYTWVEIKFNEVLPEYVELETALTQKV